MQPVQHSEISFIRNVKSRLGMNDTVQVKIPETILKSYSQGEINGLIFSEDGWFDTHISGSASEKGIVVSTLVPNTNSENENINKLRTLIEKKCHYISIIAIITKTDKEWIPILFPRTGMFSHPDYEISPMDGCFCPRDINELGKCLAGCLKSVSQELSKEGTNISSFLIAEGIFYS